MKMFFMKINNFCDVLKAYVCIGNWYIDTSLFDGPPSCTELNEYKDAFCPDDSFTLERIGYPLLGFLLCIRIVHKLLI